MKNVALLVSVTALLSACSVKNDSPADSTLDSSESALVEDNQESADMESDVESGVEDQLSGESQAAPGDSGDAEDAPARAERVKKNAGIFFQPAGCLVQTVAANVVTSVFTNCSGPFGLKTYNGTIVSTWSRDANKLVVRHEATDFQINGAKISGSRVIEYSKSGTVITRVRTGNWSGQTAKGKAISHQANFTTSLDLATKCFKRDGEASTTIGAREHSRKVTGLEWCGYGPRPCPNGGEITLTRKSGASVKIEFMGGQDIEVTRPNGKVAQGKIACVDRTK